MKTLTMKELEQSGIPARTIRFYIASKLLPGPIRQGPGAPYTEDHLAILKRIRELQAEGLTLDQIRQNLVERPVSLKSVNVQVFPVTAGVEVRVDEEIPRQRKNVIFRALETFARALQTDEKEDDNG